VKRALQIMFLDLKKTKALLLPVIVVVLASSLILFSRTSQVHNEESSNTKEMTVDSKINPEISVNKLKVQPMDPKETTATKTDQKSVKNKKPNKKNEAAINSKADDKSYTEDTIDNLIVNRKLREGFLFNELNLSESEIQSILDHEDSITQELVDIFSSFSDSMIEKDGTDRGGESELKDPRFYDLAEEHKDILSQFLQNNSIDKYVTFLHSKKLTHAIQTSEDNYNLGTSPLGLFYTE
jgi:hypothetical protein